MCLPDNYLQVVALRNWILLATKTEFTFEKTCLFRGLIKSSCIFVSGVHCDCDCRGCIAIADGFYGFNAVIDQS